MNAHLFFCILYCSPKDRSDKAKAGNPKLQDVIRRTVLTLNASFLVCPHREGFGSEDFLQKVSAQWYSKQNKIVGL